MLEKMIGYFAKRHLLTNVIALLVFIGGVTCWQAASKEEMPDITFDRMRISVRYPGAPSEDVEYLVTKPIEEAIRGLDGVIRVESTSGVGECNISVELEPDYPNRDEAFTEIRNAVLDVDLPSEVIDDPDIRVFKTSKKAILDVAVIDKSRHLLDYESRRKLQEVALALENHLINLKSVNSVNRKGYMQPEIQIRAIPGRLLEYRIPFSTVMNEVQRNHIRKPAGNIEAPTEPKVTLLSELDTVEKLSEVIVQGGFEGQVIRLNQVADIENAFEKTPAILKVNGHEAVMFSVVKNSSYGILKALDQVRDAVGRFQKTNLEGSNIDVVLLDDESIDIRNRLSLVSINGSIGFILILLTLFVFLNKRSGIWVAFGIPFTICFTLIGGHLMGFTINGTTLAAVIIVMGIVVDDAIVVAENITRYFHQGMRHKEAVVKGTVIMALPIVASILTTCIAFVPLYFFEGRFGSFVEFIPPIIFLMLGASLFESLFILPSHMDNEFPFIRKLFPSLLKTEARKEKAPHWFDRVEENYGAVLVRLLPKRHLIAGGFCLLLVVSGGLGTRFMKYEMFPNEETRDIVIAGEAPAETKRLETAELTRKIEDIVTRDWLGREVVGMRTQIAESRRGGAVEENKFRMIVEIVPKEKRSKSADQIVKSLQAEVDKLEGFEKVQFQKSRWGSDSGSAVELIVQENSNVRREALVKKLGEELKKISDLQNVEIEQGLRIPEYRIDINREKIKRLAINPTDIANTIRASLQGTVLYQFFNGDEDVYVRFTVVDEAKNDIERVLDLPVENQGAYLVPLRDVVSVEERVAPNAVTRLNLKRTSFVFADTVKGARQTPLEIAEYVEDEIFPSLLAQYPTAVLSFGGEIFDTRESQGDFQKAVLLVTVLIYVVLVILFNSLTYPLIIMLAIPFGVVGVILAFLLHGKFLFGFYAGVGVLGLAGVVINDSIIMLDKLNREYDAAAPEGETDRQIAFISQTRLRAVVLTTVTTVAGVLPTAYGFAGYDAMLAEMMLALAWGLVFGTLITLFLVPCIFRYSKDLAGRVRH